MKYRLLTLEELKELEPEFIKFLAVQQITADDWERLKKDQPERVQQLIEQFSDLVMEQSLGRVKYLQHRSQKMLRVYYCAEDKIILNGLEVEGADVDLTKAEDVAKMANPSTMQGKVRIFQKEKAYEKPRAEEIYAMLTAGCFLSDERMFQTLEKMYQEEN